MREWKLLLGRLFTPELAGERAESSQHLYDINERLIFSGMWYMLAVEYANPSRALNRYQKVNV